MRDNKKLVGATLAVTAALTFASVPLTSVYAEGAQVQCFGINGCKGQSACKTANSACKGQNACKSQGFIFEPSAKDCTDAGGKTS